jgi:hypothetical protein
MNQAHRARITYIEEERLKGKRGFWIGFSGPFGSTAFQDALSAIKSIPASDRKYDPDTHLWWISADMLPFLAIDLPDLNTYKSKWQGAYHREQEPPPRRSGPFLPPETEKAFALLCLTPNAPKELIEAARRCYARLHHPDHGGSTAVMKDYNVAADRAIEWVERVTCAA